MFTTRKVKGKTVVEISVKDMDSSIATAFRNYLVDAIEGTPDAIVILDFSKVRFLDSTCLGALLAAYRQTGSNRKLVLAAPQPSVENVFTVARVSRAMLILGSVDGALGLIPEQWPLNQPGRH